MTIQLKKKKSSPSLLLDFLGDVGNDGFGSSLKDQLSFDERGHGVALGGGAWLLCFHRHRSVLIICRDVTVAMATFRLGALCENCKVLLQFYLLAVKNVMSNNEHWHTLVGGEGKFSLWQSYMNLFKIN